MTYDEDYFVGESHYNQQSDTITDLANWIKTRLVMLNRSLRTSECERERQQLLSAITLCSASLSLLTLAYTSEIEDITTAAKEILRELV